MAVDHQAAAEADGDTLATLIWHHDTLEYSPVPAAQAAPGEFRWPTASTQWPTTPRHIDHMLDDISSTCRGSSFTIRRVWGVGGSQLRHRCRQRRFDVGWLVPGGGQVRPQGKASFLVLQQCFSCSKTLPFFYLSVARRSLSQRGGKPQPVLTLAYYLTAALRSERGEDAAQILIRTSVGPHSGGSGTGWRSRLRTRR